MPLQEGLRELAGRGTNRLQKFCLEIGGRVERGQTLADAIGEIGKDLPPSYRLLIEAGARTGNLSGRWRPHPDPRSGSSNSAG